MSLTHDDFWSKILRCSTEGITSINDFLGEPEIRYLQVSVAADQQVLRLEISVRDLSLMQILEGQSDFCNIKQSDIVWKDILFSQQPKYLTALHELKDQVQIKPILERLNQIYDEWVLDTGQNILFVLNVHDLLELDDLLFVQHFEGVRLIVAESQINFTKGSSADDSY